MNTFKQFILSPRGKGLVTLGVFLGLAFYAGFVRAPIAFPTGELITIAEGKTIQREAHQL